MTKYKKTRVMNLIGGWSLALLGVALFFNKLGNQSIGVLASIVVIYSIMVGTALGTVQALKDDSSVKLRVTAVWLNWFLVGFYALGVAATVLGTFAAPDVMKQMLIALIPGTLAFVIPELINIHALRSIQSPSENEA